MKKLFYFAGLLAIICLGMSCKGKSSTGGASKDTVAGAARQTAGDKTLNGYDGLTARTMIGNFETSFVNLDQVMPSRFAPPSSLYAFYNYAEIKTMDSVLHQEIDINKKLINGVRIYLGTKNPWATANEKAEYHMFIIATTDTDGNKKNYYDIQNANWNSPHGDATQDNEGTAYDNGARLFRKDPGSDNCNSPGYYRWVNNKDAYNWVQRRTNTTPNGDNGYNTRAAWFDICFIRGLFKTILNDTTPTLSGLRIYIGNGYKVNGVGMERDFFLLVPTTKQNGVDEDYYPCIHQLGYFGSCVGFNAVPDSTHNAFIDRISKIGLMMPGGYDKGELCPTICN